MVFNEAPHKPRLHRAFIAMIISFFSVPLTMAGINYFIDPLMAMHGPWYRQQLFYHDERYMSPGYVSQFPASTVILGTSTMQPFQKDVFPEGGRQDVINLAISASTLYEQRLILNQAIQTSKVKHVIWGLEWVASTWPLSKVTVRFGPFPHFLYDRRDRLFVDYFLNIDILALSQELVEAAWRGKQSSNFNVNPEFTKLSSSSRPFGIFRVLKDYFCTECLQEATGTLGSPERMDKNNFLRNLDENLKSVLLENPDIQFDLVIPPNSILMLVWLQDHFPDQWENFLVMRRKLSEFSALPNVRVFDFYQDTRFLYALEEYGDLQHFSKKIARKIVDSIATDQFRMGDGSSEDILVERVRRFRKLCPDADLNRMHTLGEHSKIEDCECLRTIQSNNQFGN